MTPRKTLRPGTAPKSEEKFMLWLRKQVMLANRQDRLEARLEEMGRELGRVKAVANELYAERLNAMLERSSAAHREGTSNPHPDGEDLPEVR